MRIGIDVSCWSNVRGYGRFARELVRAMAVQAAEDRLVCFGPSSERAIFDLQPANAEYVAVPQSAAPTQAASADGSRSVRDMFRFTRAVRRSDVDVFFCPSVYTYFPLPPGLPAVVAIHDAIAERFPKLTLPSARARLFWRLKVKLALWQARIIVTVSEFAAGDLANVLGIPLSRIRVSGEAPASVYRPSDDREDIDHAAALIGVPPEAQWFLYVGGFNPHKRLDTLIEAHSQLHARLGSATPYLLLVGPSETDSFHQDVRSIQDAVTNFGTGHLVRWPGYIPDEELRHLHSGALGLVLVSENEGFGLPAIEAAACGTPVIATTQSPLPSLLPDGGLFVNPGDTDAVADALLRLTTDNQLRERLSVGALTGARQLSWEDSATRVLSAIREAAA